MSRFLGRFLGWLERTTGAAIKALDILDVVVVW
jgi:hypothetical protein